MSILIKPVITEKATADSEMNNRFTFVVSNKANKIQIKDSIESAYGVSVTKVRTMNVRPDRNTKFTKSGMITGKTKAYKKAVVQVAEGETIDLYSNL
ncbi:MULTISPECIES: 50S ribosomal protein L23 [Christiangramia]|mgnify:FL=1|jgi:large subunit ribosomal protein L23|uniref:Large ribosomal subunit protein uL23 n=4 Tax=Christiangramia TaxID=292691 RepID=A0A1H1P411_9FLAO|nr:MULTISPECIES: 50S ribosomal protein L23 [Christiangramia]MCB7481224.1 50S ribosomal protein L23 [Christiangramia sediminis]CAL67791.1 50S ribosomal protein L23 [Christiangramia forsetii KT0803]SDS05937.1 LSU ribosomal protein L23P [Christiangramia echinicola]SDS56043.1 LSU ribosomal protein L23P [Gramella sp. MAR_2010_147]GGG21502.1 50S ribosomal protein L23 [Christiangramia forsetii]